MMKASLLAAAPRAQAGGEAELLERGDARAISETSGAAGHPAAVLPLSVQRPRRLVVLGFGQRNRKEIPLGPAHQVSLAALPRVDEPPNKQARRLPTPRDEAVLDPQPEKELAAGLARHLSAMAYSDTPLDAGRMTDDEVELASIRPLQARLKLASKNRAPAQKAREPSAVPPPAAPVDRAPSMDCAPLGPADSRGAAVKRRRCTQCANCLRPDCGACAACLQMVKFGGAGKKRQACALRRCEHLVEIPVASSNCRAADLLRGDMTEQSREALSVLGAYIESCHGDADMVQNWQVKFEMRKSGTSAGHVDTYFVDPTGRRFRSRPEILRFLGLAPAVHLSSTGAKAARKKLTATASRTQEERPPASQRATAQGRSRPPISVGQILLKSRPRWWHMFVVMPCLRRASMSCYARALRLLSSRRLYPQAFS
ncbi:hypothetical protein AB1Y20_000406 [Prymnesium parvum]|uniref:Methyl-CpG-binding domain protein 1 n=1 Tax=Prymnesium parvum TaxID=97485 RepID=A0AB34K6A9_PRYPA